MKIFDDFEIYKLSEIDSFVDEDYLNFKNEINAPNEVANFEKIEMENRDEE